MELLGERLVLRPASEGDLDFYVGLRNAPQVLASSGGRELRPKSEIERELRGWIGRWRQHGFGFWTVFERDTDERLGRVELDPMGPGWAGLSPDEIEVGCLVHPAHWNRGIATEATLLVAKDCFDRVGLDRLVALTTTDNKSSLRALEKLGMRHLGETQHERVHGTYQLFELTRMSRRQQRRRSAPHVLSVLPFARGRAPCEPFHLLRPVHYGRFVGSSLASSRVFARRSLSRLYW